MSTRCNIILKDSFGDEMIFYRHSDGYPAVTGESLDFFCTWLREKRIRANVSQGGGWLIMLGAKEYAEHAGRSQDMPYDPFGNEYGAWKVGAYEPTTCIHGDIEFLYKVDMATATWTVEPV